METLHYLVTGAGKGIGFETVRALLNKGHKVTAISRNIDELVKMAEEYASTQLMVDIVDISDSHAVDFFIEQFNLPLNGVVNNAGALVNCSFEDTLDEDWQRLLDVNVLGPVRLLRGLKKAKKLLPEAHIVNISSMGGMQGSAKFPGLSAYSTTKGALSILSESLAVEWANIPIYVNALCIGAVNTSMLKNAFPNFEASVKPQQMGSFICDFLCEHNGLINGKIIPVAGQDPS